MNGDFPKVEGFEDFPADIAEQILQALKEHKSQEQPYWIQVIGIPGSGKTTFVHMLHEAISSHSLYTLASFDTYMEKIPAYHTEDDRATAFEKFEAPARAMGFKIFEYLIQNKINVLFEHSTSFTAVRDLLYHVKKQGYRLILIYVEVDIDIAKERVKSREHVTRRHVPETVIEERSRVVVDRWNQLSDIADLKLSVINNGEVEPAEIFNPVIAEVLSCLEVNPGSLGRY